jgi:hypothetical protein
MDSEPSRTSNLKRAGLVVGLGLPPILLLLAVLRFAVDFPYWDDWAYLYGTIEYLDPARDWTYVFARQGSHINASTKLIFWAAYVFADANLKIIVYLNYLLTWLVFAGMVLLLKRSLPAGGYGWVWYPLAALFSFSLGQWPVFFSAWGSCWLLLPVFLRGGMLLTNTRLGFFGLTVCLAICSLAASLTLAAGFAFWAAFPFYLWLSGRLPARPFSRRHWSAFAVWLAGTAFCFAMLANVFNFGDEYETTTNFLARDNDPPLLMLAWCLEQPHRAIGFMLALLGSSASHVTTIIPGLGSDTAAVSVAIVNGGISFILFALTLGRVFRADRDPELLKRVAPWIAIAVVELVMATLVTVGRGGGYTLYRALSPHYGMIGLQFQFAAYVGAYLLWRDSSVSTTRIPLVRYLGGLAVGALAMVLAQLGGQVRLLADVRENAHQKQFARDALYVLRVLPPSSWPAPLRIVRLHRLEEYARRDALSLADQEEIEAQLTRAEDSRLLKTGSGGARFELNFTPELHLSGHFQAELAEESPTLLIELRGPDANRVLLPAKAKARNRPHEFHCDQSHSIFDHTDHRVESVYAFRRSSQTFLRIYRAPANPNP